MRKERMWNPIDIDELLRAFAASPQAAALRAAIRAQPCPAPEAVAAFCRGEWAEPQAQQFQRHLLGCPTCAQHVARLRHTQPAPAEVLLSHLHYVIPAGPAGAQLGERIARHLQACDACRAECAQVVELLHWTDALHQAWAQLAWVRQLVTGLSVLALTHQQRRHQAAARGRDASKGQRRPAGEEVTGVVLDAAGRLVVDATGAPRTVPFTVHRTFIDRQRRLAVELQTADTTYCQPGGPVYTVHGALPYEHQPLCFAPAAICPGDPASPYPSGVATVRAELGSLGEVHPLPLAALRLTIQPQESGGSAHGDVPHL